MHCTSITSTLIGISRRVTSKNRMALIVQGVNSEYSPGAGSPPAGHNGPRAWVPCRGCARQRELDASRAYLFKHCRCLRFKFMGLFHTQTLYASCTWSLILWWPTCRQTLAEVSFAPTQMQNRRQPWKGLPRSNWPRFGWSCQVFDGVLQFHSRFETVQPVYEAGMACDNAEVFEVVFLWRSSFRSSLCIVNDDFGNAFNGMDTQYCCLESIFLIESKY